MSEQKVFRVQLVETGVYYLDVRAKDEEEAKRKVTVGLDEGFAYPIHDPFSSSGYTIDTVHPMPEELAEVDAQFEENLALHSVAS